jgi:hypothetical protein
MFLLLFGPQVFCNGVASCIWNPWLTAHGAYAAVNSLGDRFRLFWLSWRDLQQAEFISLPLLALALGLGVTRGRVWLVRGVVALGVYVAVIALGSPQPARFAAEADVRYLAPIIPLAVALEAGALGVIFERQAWLAVAAAVLVFGTNLLKGGPLLETGWSSTILSFVGELRHPPPEPYTPTAAWINAQVREGESVWVQPDYAMYPLMFHAPRAVYAWQLDWPARPDLATLPPIHFRGREAPDYLVAFGPWRDEMPRMVAEEVGTACAYKQVATIPVFWKDLYRPELFWRRSVAYTDFDLNSEAIYIFQRTEPPILGGAGKAGATTGGGCDGYQRGMGQAGG